MEPWGRCSKYWVSWFLTMFLHSLTYFFSWVIITKFQVLLNFFHTAHFIFYIAQFFLLYIALYYSLLILYLANFGFWSHGRQGRIKGGQRVKLPRALPKWFSTRGIVPPCLPSFRPCWRNFVLALDVRITIAEVPLQVSAWLRQVAVHCLMSTTATGYQS